MKRFHLALLFGLLGAGWPLPAAEAADPWPVRAVRVVVPFAPGGGSDIVARTLGQKLAVRQGQSAAPRRAA